MKMQGRIFLVTVLALVVLGAAGCATRINESPRVGIDDIKFKELERNEYEILGTVEATGKVTTYLGIITVPFFDRNVGVVVPVGGDFPLAMETRIFRGGQQRAFEVALFNALGEFPDADILLPVSAQVVTSDSFFVTEYTATVKCKAIRIKSDDEL